jgi:hypothetical protein
MKGFGLGFIVAVNASLFWTFAFAQGVLIGLFGSFATFAPLMTEISFWFNKSRITAGARRLHGLAYFTGLRRFRCRFFYTGVRQRQRA